MDKARSEFDFSDPVCCLMQTSRDFLSSWNKTCLPSRAPVTWTCLCLTPRLCACLPEAGQPSCPELLGTASRHYLRAPCQQARQGSTCAPPDTWVHLLHIFLTACLGSPVPLLPQVPCLCQMHRSDAPCFPELEESLVDLLRSSRSSMPTLSPVANLQSLGRPCAHIHTSWQW